MSFQTSADVNRSPFAKGFGDDRRSSNLLHLEIPTICKEGCPIPNLHGRQPRIAHHHGAFAIFAERRVISLDPIEAIGLPFRRLAFHLHVEQIL